MKVFLEKAKYFLKTNYKWIIAFICICVVLLLIKDIMNKNILELDEMGYSLISKYIISDFMTPFARFITFFASKYWLLGFSIILIILIKNKKISLYICINLVLNVFLNFLLKFIFQRPRPEGYRLIDESGYSLPSGHSMVSMAFYGFLIYLIHKNVKNKFLKVMLITLLILLIICIGISRIYLGVHYTSDVITGFLISIAYLILFIHIVKSKI